MCYQSEIANQFEFMQNSWADNGNFLRPGTGLDSVIGQPPPGGNPGTPQWPKPHGGPGTVREPFANFVHLRGGEYFFTPSISFLKTL